MTEPRRRTENIIQTAATLHKRRMYAVAIGCLLELHYFQYIWLVAVGFQSDLQIAKQTAGGLHRLACNSEPK